MPGKWSQVHAMLSIILLIPTPSSTSPDTGRSASCGYFA